MTTTLSHGERERIGLVHRSCMHMTSYNQVLAALTGTNTTTCCSPIIHCIRKMRYTSSTIQHKSVCNAPEYCSSSSSLHLLHNFDKLRGACMLVATLVAMPFRMPFMLPATKSFLAALRYSAVLIACPRLAACPCMLVCTSTPLAWQRGLLALSTW